MERTISLIPEFYFDLIARILPGTSAFICFSYAISEKIYRPVSLQEGLFGLGICYVFGLVLNFMCDAWLSRLDKPKVDNQDARLNPNRAIIKYFTRVDNPKAYSILLKMCAELILLRSLFTIFFLLLIWSIVTCLIQGVSDHINNIGAIGAVFVVCVLLFSLCRYTSDRISERFDDIKKAADKSVHLCPNKT